MSRILRLVVTGPECTGKTTLVQALAAHYGVAHSAEFVRGYAEQRSAPIGAPDHWPIARGQIALEEAAMAEARGARHRLVLLDTDLLSTVVYARAYVGQCDYGIEQLARARLADHYLLLDIDVPWVADGVRDPAARREVLHHRFRGALEEFGAPFTLVRGSWDERLTGATTVADRLLHLF